MKLESEDFPPGVANAADKQRYADELNEAMPGLGLDWRRVKKNEGRRSFAKGTKSRVKRVCLEI